MLTDSTAQHVLRGRLIRVALAFALGAAGHSNAQTAASSGRFAREEATFQLSLTMKIRADQAFLVGDRLAAKMLYDGAASELSTISNPNWSSDNELLKLLLASDISYRQTLLRYDADFWGATYSLKPINPVEAFDRLERTVAQLDELVTRMEAERGKISSSAALALAWQAAGQGAKTDADAQALKAITEEIKGNSHAEKATAAQDRIDRNVRRQKEIANERVKLSAQFDAAHKQFDSLVVNAALQAAGIPPELKQLADQDKPLEQRILAAGRSAIASNSDIVKSFGAFSETTAKIADAARSVDEGLSQIEKIERIKKSSESAIAALRKGTLDGALEAGKFAYDQLSQGDKDRLASFAIDAKPLNALIASAKSVKPALDVIARAVKSDHAMAASLRAMLAERALENAPALDRWYRGQLANAARVANASGTAGVIAQQAITAWPQGFLSKLPEAFRKKLLEAHKLPNEQDLARKLFGSWPPTDVQVTVSGADIEARVGQLVARVNLQAFVEGQEAASTEVVKAFAEDAAKLGDEAAKAQLRDRLSSRVVSMIEANDGLANQLISAIDGIDEMSSLSRIIPAAAGRPDSPASRQLFDSVWTELGTDARRQAGAQLAMLHAGSMLAKDIVGSDKRRPPGNPVTTSGAKGKAEEAVAKAAVAAAFPAAAVAIVAIDAAKAFSEMSSLADQINALTDEDKRIMSEQLTLFDLVRDERAATALADLGVRIAETRRRGALMQADRYERAAQRLDEAAMRAVGAERLFLPRATLLAELLRFQFDQLDRSLAFWTGDPRATKGHIAREVASDPQWLRYALDPSIQLFSWLKRDGEQDRGDLPRVAAEWQQKLQIASAVCDKLKCKKDSAVVGEVTTSSELSLKSLDPAQWKRFETWQSSGVADFVFELLVTPSVLNPDKRMHNIRYVAARAGVLKSGNTTVTVAGMRLEHSGAAYVPFEDGYIKEHYLPKVAYGITWNPFGDLRVRWRSTLALAPLEGYGVYTLWRLAVPVSSDSRAARDVKLQFSYQFQDKASVPDDRALDLMAARKRASLVFITTPDKLQVSIPLSDLPFITSDQGAVSVLNSLASDTSAASAGLTGIKVVQQAGAPR